MKKKKWILGKKRIKRKIKKIREEQKIKRSVLLVAVTATAVAIIALSQQTDTEADQQMVLVESASSQKSWKLPTAGITAELADILCIAEYGEILPSAGITQVLQKQITISKKPIEIVESAEEASEQEIAEPEEEEPSELAFPAQAHETYLLAQIIECEAGQTVQDKIYVGSVVLNRTRTNYKDFRKVTSVREVLYHHFGRRDLQQYATKTVRKIESGIKPSEASLEVAEGLISGEISCLEESILFQDICKQKWMYGKLQDVSLEGACQYYGKPLDFVKGCQQ